MSGFASFGQPFNNSIFARPSNSSLGTTTGFNQAKPFSFGTQNTGLGFTNQTTGSRRAAYTVTRSDENTKLLSLSAMEVYSAKSHEELRFEDYNAGDKGGIAKSSPSFSSVAPQNPSNPFSTQTTSNLFSSQTSLGFVSTQTTNSNPFQSSPGLFTTQTTNSNPFQSSSGLFSTQTTNSNPFQSSSGLFSTQTTNTNPCQSSSGLFSTQNTNTNPFQSSSGLFSTQKANTNPFQSSSGLFSTQTANSNPFQSSSGIFSTQTTNSNPFQSSSGFLSTQTTNSNPFQSSSTCSPHTSFSPFSNQTTPGFVSQNFNKPFDRPQPQTSFNGFTSQTSSSLISPQTPGFLSTQTSWVNPNPPKTTTSIFPSQATTNNPFLSQTAPSIFTSQTSPSLISTQTTSNPFPSQTTSIFSPQTSSNPFTSQTVSKLSPPQPSFNGFTTNSFSPFSNQTSLAVPPNNFSAFNQVPLPTPPSQIIGLQPTSVIGTSISSQGPPAALNTAVDQLVINRNPFGELPAVNHLTISQTGPTISVQYGISSLPVQNKPPVAVRLSSSLTSRPLSHSRMRLPARKYDSKTDSLKVPFFSRDKENSMRTSTLVPRENPRAFVLSAELWPQRSGSEEVSPGGVSSENNTKKEPDNVLNINLAVYEPDHREAEISKEVDEINALMPQLSIPEYYTKPPINQMAEKEMEEAGFCSCVKDFEIGRYGYGNIKFLGETDVRKLCLDSLVEFNNREVVVYKDENEKPPVGEGLNKLAEVTLLNIHCVDKKTRQKYVDGPKVEKYKEMLKKKGEEQGAEFISFDAVKGEWKFRVQHF